MSNYCTNIINIYCETEKTAKKIFSVLFDSDLSDIFKRFQIQDVDNSFLYSLDMVNYMIKNDAVEELFNKIIKDMDNEYNSVKELLEKGYDIVSKGMDDYDENDSSILYNSNNIEEIINYIVNKIKRWEYRLYYTSNVKKVHVCRLYQKNPLSVYRNTKNMKYDIKTKVDELDSSNNYYTKLMGTKTKDPKCSASIVDGTTIHVEFESDWTPLEGFFFLLTLYYPVRVQFIYYEDGTTGGYIEMEDGEYLREDIIQTSSWLELEIMMFDILEQKYEFDDGQVLEDLKDYMEDNGYECNKDSDFNIFGQDVIERFLMDCYNFESVDNAKKYIKYLKKNKKLNKKIKIRRVKEI